MRIKISDIFKFIYGMPQRGYLYGGMSALRQDGESYHGLGYSNAHKSVWLADKKMESIVNSDSDYTKFLLAFIGLNDINWESYNGGDIGNAYRPERLGSYITIPKTYNVDARTEINLGVTKFSDNSSPRRVDMLDLHMQSTTREANRGVYFCKMDETPIETFEFQGRQIPKVRTNTWKIPVYVDANTIINKDFTYTDSPVVFGDESQNARFYNRLDKIYGIEIEIDFMPNFNKPSSEWNIEEIQNPFFYKSIKELGTGTRYHFKKRYGFKPETSTEEDYTNYKIYNNKRGNRHCKYIIHGEALYKASELKDIFSRGDTESFTKAKSLPFLMYTTLVHDSDADYVYNHRYDGIGDRPQDIHIFYENVNKSIMHNNLPVYEIEDYGSQYKETHPYPLNSDYVHVGYIVIQMYSGMVGSALANGEINSASTKKSLIPERYRRHDTFFKVTVSASRNFSSCTWSADGTEENTRDVPIKFLPSLYYMDADDVYLDKVEGGIYPNIEGTSYEVSSQEAWGSSQFKRIMNMGGWLYPSENEAYSSDVLADCLTKNHVSPRYWLDGINISTDNSCFYPTMYYSPMAKRLDEHFNPGKSFITDTVEEYTNLTGFIES